MSTLDIITLCNAPYYHINQLQFYCSWVDELNIAATSTEMSKKMGKYSDFIEYLKDKTGIPKLDIWGAFAISGNLRSALSLGLPLPDWCSEDDYKKLEAIVDHHSDWFIFTESMKRKVVGTMVEQFLKNIKSHMYPMKIHLYSAHDINIVTFIKAHNLTGTPLIVDYGSTLIIETLRGLDGGLYIRLAIWTGVSKELIPLKLENCAAECPIEDYLNFVQPFLPDDETKKCVYFARAGA